MHPVLIMIESLWDQQAEAPNDKGGSSPSALSTTTNSAWRRAVSAKNGL